MKRRARWCRRSMRAIAVLGDEQRQRRRCSHGCACIARTARSPAQPEALSRGRARDTRGAAAPKRRLQLASIVTTGVRRRRSSPALAALHEPSAKPPAPEPAAVVAAVAPEVAPARFRASSSKRGQRGVRRSTPDDLRACADRRAHAQSQARAKSASRSSPRATAARTHSALRRTTPELADCLSRNRELSLSALSQRPARSRRSRCSARARRADRAAP